MWIGLRCNIDMCLDHDAGGGLWQSRGSLFGSALRLKSGACQIATAPYMRNQPWNYTRNQFWN